MLVIAVSYRARALFAKRVAGPIMRRWRCIETSAGRIGLTEAGSGAATPILFLHGVGSDKSVWHPQLDHFGAERRAIAIDYPGYGDSEPKAAATRDDFARAALATLDALGIERAHICGLSLGGVVAIAMHALAPGRCASLILADTFAVHPEGQAIHDRSVAASQAMSMRELAEARAAMLLGAAASAAIKAEVIATMGAIDPAAYRLGAAAVWLADQRDRVAAIDVPTLVLVGEEDSITPPALSRDLHELVGSAAPRRASRALVTIAQAGHLANLEQPERSTKRSTNSSPNWTRNQRLSAALTVMFRRPLSMTRDKRGHGQGASPFRSHLSLRHARAWRRERVACPVRPSRHLRQRRHAGCPHPARRSLE